MRSLIALVLLLSLSGCAELQQQQATKQQQTQLQNYVTINKPLAKEGKMKWSDYYMGMYEIFQASNFIDRGFMMQTLAECIDVAKKYEAGTISKDEFDSFKLKKEADVAANVDNMKMEQAKIQALRPPPVYIPPPAYQPPPMQPIRMPTQTNCYRMGNNVNCTTY